MKNQQQGISRHTVNLSYRCLKQMINVVHDLQSLCENPAYPAKLPKLPGNAQVNPKYFSVLMGYDFHIDDTQQAKLIEVNTNAGGLWFVTRCYQPDAIQYPSKLADKLLTTFLQEYRLFRQDPNAQPHLIAIIDHLPEQQFLYPEMRVFAQLFQQVGIKTVIIDPGQVEMQGTKLYYQDQAIDLIYNRHCDFYLNTTEMQHIANAWQQQSVCLTPNPRIYGLLADKQRMVDWSHPEFFNGLLAPAIASRLQQAIPHTQLLSSLSKDTLWSGRKDKVFKPTTSYASQGVYVGDKLTKNKLSSLMPETTLVQQHIKPTITFTPDGEKFKTDFRLFVYRKTILAISARLYQGQVTNLRTANGGFSKIKLTSTQA
ncbi:hypothetical protein AU255_19150 [Methyloprofundus sedimenti]|uniref:Glutathionylspermidine synthase pre-ATP-grasp-like domain-containing protein n=2 Tax=Methyloprofundus sedimenti TaxID=1420851 RepID=A0A1V8M0M7_9GAMM|nr:hypothetical protein AU255_19150 [Methyloprofundus sedimenti]